MWTVETGNWVAGWRVELKANSRGEKGSWITVVVVMYAWSPEMSWPGNVAAETALVSGDIPVFISRGETMPRVLFFPLGWVIQLFLGSFEVQPHIFCLLYFQIQPYKIFSPSKLKPAWNSNLATKKSNLYRLIKWGSDCRGACMLGSGVWTRSCGQRGLLGNIIHLGLEI